MGFLKNVTQFGPAIWQTVANIYLHMSEELYDIDSFKFFIH